MTWGTSAWGTAPYTAPAGAALGTPPAYALADTQGPLFLAAEIEVFRPGGTGPARMEAWGVVPFAAASVRPDPIQDFVTLRVSDLGWVTKPTDPAGIQPYAPILAAGVTVDRAMALAPDGAGAAAGWGGLTLVNDRDALTALAASGNVDGRPITVRMGRKRRLAHGYWADPAYADTAPLLSGLGAALTLDERELRVALRDPGYWLERSVDGAAYLGTGGLEGGAALAGKRKPRVRGGTPGDPVREVAPELVDPTLGIYQVSDSFGAIVALYERGAATITNAGGVADITAVVPAAGTFRWESSARGLFLRLGTFPPAGTITVDCVGSFPDGTTPTTPAAIALQVMLQDLGVPAANIDAGSFAGVAAAAPWTAGFALAAGEQVDGVTLIGMLMRSAAARLVPARTGLLRAVQFAPIPAGTVPTATYTAAQILDCRRLDLPAPMMPPPSRIRVGWGRNHTVQTSALAPTLTGARIGELAEPYRVAVATAAAVSTAWRRPSDPPVIETMLTNQTNAGALATLLRDLWGIAAGRALWSVTLPLAYALRHDLGEPIVLAYPGPLRSGALVRIVGEQLRTADDLATLTVLG